MADGINALVVLHPIFIEAVEQTIEAEESPTEVALGVVFFTKDAGSLY